MDTPVERPVLMASKCDCWVSRGDSCEIGLEPDIVKLELLCEHLAPCCSLPQRMSCTHKFVFNLNMSGPTGAPSSTVFPSKIAQQHFLPLFATWEQKVEDELLSTNGKPQKV